jgi:hypothetical protein
MNRRFARQAILFALLYYLAFVALDDVIFLLSHVPPKAMNLDRLIFPLFVAERILAWPRLVLRWLWPGESTPACFNLVMTVLNCLVWGLALASLKALWTKVRM